VSLESRPDPKRNLSGTRSPETISSSNRDIFRTPVQLHQWRKPTEIYSNSPHGPDTTHQSPCSSTLSCESGCGRAGSGSGDLVCGGRLGCFVINAGHSFLLIVARRWRVSCLRHRRRRTNSCSTSLQPVDQDHRSQKQHTAKGRADCDACYCAVGQSCASGGWGGCCCYCHGCETVLCLDIRGRLG
jgi:hypothetical protein